MPSGIQHLELYNFKSYRGKHLVGPFKSFTCIVGPNGSGKSNIMDAVTFVLGYGAGKMRADRAQDLITTVGAEDGSPATNAYVEMVFAVSPTDKRIFRREVRRIPARRGSTGGEPEAETIYTYNGSAVSKRDYDARLSELGFVASKSSAGAAPSCLVAQNEVESLLSRSPAQLAHYIESISGGMALAEEYAKVLIEAQDTESELVTLLRTRQHASREQKLAKTEAEVAAKHEELQEELDALNRERDLVGLWHMHRGSQEAVIAVEDAKVALEEAQEAAASVNERADAAVVAAAKAKRVLQVAAREADEANKADKEAKRARERLQGQVTFLEEKEEGLKGRIEEVAEKRKQREGMIKSLKQEIAKMEKEEAKLKKTWEGEAKKREEEDGLLSDFRAALQKAETVTSGARARAARVNGEVAAAETDVGLCRSRVGVLESTVTARTKRLEGLKEQLLAVEARVRDAEAALATETEEMDTLEASIVGRERERKALEDELRDLRGILSRYEGTKVRGVEQQRVMGALGGLVSSGDVIGKMRALTGPSEPRFETAVRAGLGRHNDSLVVRDGAAAQRALAVLKEQRAGTATFIPLDVRVRVQEVDRVRRALPAGYWMLVDVVSVRGGEGEQRAVAWACGSTVVAADMDDARAIAFGTVGAEARGDNQQRLKVVCLDGSVIHQSGAMSAGNVAVRANIPNSGAGTGATVGAAGQRGRRRPRDDTEASTGTGTGTGTDAEEVVLSASEVAAAKARAEDISTRLVALGSGSGGGSGEAMQATLMQMRTRLAAARERARLLSSTAAALTAEVSTASVALSAAQSDFEAARSALEAAEARLEETKRVAEAESRKLAEASLEVLQSVSDRVGVPAVDLHTWARSIEDRRASQSEQLRSLSLTLQTLRQRLELETTDSEEEEELQAQLRLVRRDLDQCRELFERMVEEMERLHAKSLQLSSRVATLRSQSQAAELAKAEAEQAKADALSRERNSGNAVAIAETRLQQAKRQWEDEISRVASVGGAIKLIRRAGTGTGTGTGVGRQEEKSGKSGSKRSRNSAGVHTSTSSSSSSGSGSGVDEPQEIMLSDALANPSLASILWSRYEVDFSSLPDDPAVSGTLSPPAVAQLLQSYAAVADQLQQQLLALAPHAHTAEQLQAAAAKHAQARTQVQTLQAQHRAATARLATLGEARRQRFERAVTLLDRRASAVFAGVSGGSLRVSTTGDSFHGGCTVTVSTPGKRARDAGMLSGGEQALVAVAMAIGANAVSRMMAREPLEVELAASSGAGAGAGAGAGGVGGVEEGEEGEEKEGMSDAVNAVAAAGVGTGAGAGAGVGGDEEGVILVDEVDAAMDSGNVRRVGAMLRERARRGGQCLCVSLKEGLYAQADALVGVYRDQGGGSRILTLDLNAFREE